MHHIGLVAGIRHNLHILFHWIGQFPDSTHFSHLSLIARRCSFCSFDQLGGLTLTDSESPGMSLAFRIKLVAEKASVLQPAISPGSHQQHDRGFPMSRTELFTDDHQRMPGHTTILTHSSHARSCCLTLQHCMHSPISLKRYRRATTQILWPKPYSCWSFCALSCLFAVFMDIII